MMALGVGVTVQDGRAVVFVHGEIDIASMRVLAQVLRDVVASDAAVVVIDLSGVEFMSTSAVNMLTKARKALVSKGRELRVVAPGGSAPARVLQALRVSAGALPVFPTRAAALAGVVLGPRRAPHAAESVQGPDLS